MEELLDHPQMLRKQAKNVENINKSE